MPLMEFSEETGEYGLPLWERPQFMGLLYPGSRADGRVSVKHQLLGAFSDHIDEMTDQIVEAHTVDKSCSEFNPIRLISRDSTTPTLARLEIRHNYITYGAFYVAKDKLYRVLNNKKPTVNNGPVCDISDVTKVMVISHGT